LFSDENNEGVAPGKPWENGPVPEDKAVYGLGPIEITVSYYDDFKKILQDVYGMKPIIEEDNVTLLNVGAGGNGGQVILRRDEGAEGRQGYGEVHHVSFRVEDHAALAAWEEKYRKMGLGNSGLVDRFYYEALDESLALPPFLEPKRAQIEAAIRPFDTRRNK